MKHSLAVRMSIAWQTSRKRRRRCRNDDTFWPDRRASDLSAAWQMSTASFELAPSMNRIT